MDGRPAGLARSVVRALRPGPAPMAVAAAVRTTIAAGVIAVGAAVLGDARTLSVAYLGAACAAAFVQRGTYRAQAVALLAQAVGAVLGLALGSVGTGSVLGMIAVATVAGAVSGVLGGLGPAAPGFGMMLAIGVAFAQFGGSTLSWWQQSASYLTGTVLIAVATLAPWPWRRGVRERVAVAEVFAAAADLGAVIGTPAAREARSRLAAASARARAATHHVHAELVAFVVAALYARQHPLPPAAVEAVRTAGAQAGRGQPVAVPLQGDGDPDLDALADALAPRPGRVGAPVPGQRWRAAAVRSLIRRGAAVDGARVALSLGAATALTLALHEQAHSFWLPLTVAVVVRPEYASVFVRAVNRVSGTIVGAVLAAGVLVLVPTGPPVAIAAAVALGGAVLTAPRLYAWNVVGVTASALLATSIATADPAVPAVRLLDTVLGAAVAIVVGHLPWSRTRRTETAVRLGAALAAARAYLAVATTPPSRRQRWQETRDDAYRLAHEALHTAERALLEPPPVGAHAAAAVTAAARLEDAVDLVTAVASAVDSGRPADGVAAVEDRLDAIERELRA